MFCATPSGGRIPSPWRVARTVVGSGTFTWSAAHGIEDLHDALERMGIDTDDCSLRVLDVLELGGATYLVGTGQYRTEPPVMWRALHQ